ncbi:glycosyltransferase family 39 protein [Dysgonomonas sp. 25]|uniref:glycosyltransferase family 39 protein n=1 Tax=Dysgonomonas sp. 25 TaxID=2302933 RepID=UPI0013D52DD5|nr:glycosyltransferase family 39 protein [Dysgonomonas sp. 25]NDV70196.1 hypothetical protein [Dysgonomonas sp. 25]
MRSILYTKTFLYTFLIVVGTMLFLYLDYIDILLNFDDAYTLQMAKHSLGDIYNIATTNDAHPPLYYWMLKIYSYLFGDSIVAGRAFSTVGILASMLFSALVIRKRLGDKVATIFIVLLIIFPVSQYLATEIRMYSWTMFFTLASAIYSYDAYDKGRVIDWVKFVAMALCASFTHYYGLVTVMWMFTILFFLLFFLKRRQQKQFIISSLVYGVFYLPWIVRLLYQMRHVGHQFWIKPVSLEDLLYHIYYFFSIKKDWLPFDDETKMWLMYGSVLIMVFIFILLADVYIKGYVRKDKLATASVLLLVIFLLPIVSGFILSYAFRPIIVPRYMTCSFGLFLLSMAIIIRRSMETRWFRILAILTMVLLAGYGSLRYYATYRYLKQEVHAYNHMHRFINDNPTYSKTFLSEYFESSALSRLSIFYPESNYYVLIPEGWNDNLAPFNIKKVHHKQVFEGEFILVQKPHEEGGVTASEFRKALNVNYMAMDSTKALNMILYKMKVRPEKIVTEDEIQTN